MREKRGKRGGVIRKAGTTLTGIGILLMLAGMCLFLWNRREASVAAERAADVLARLKNAVETEAAMPENGADGRETDLSAADGKGNPETNLPTVTIDGYEYAGYIGIPALELELPVMAQWSYPRLKIAPCRYCGTADANNLVIAAHNYPRHFGRLSKLQKGDEVYFTDMEGTALRYRVEAVDVLAPEAVEEMTDGEYGLTLFTCTYGGANRVTVRCAVE